MPTDPQPHHHRPQADLRSHRYRHSYQPRAMGHTYIQDIRKGAVEASARYAEALDARMPAPPLAHTACTTHIRGTVELAAAVPDE